MKTSVGEIIGLGPFHTFLNFVIDYVLKAAGSFGFIHIDIMSCAIFCVMPQLIDSQA